MTPHEQPREPKGLTTGGQWSRKPQPAPMQGSSVGSGGSRDVPIMQRIDAEVRAERARAKTALEAAARAYDRDPFSTKAEDDFVDAAQDFADSGAEATNELEQAAVAAIEASDEAADEMFTPANVDNAWDRLFDATLGMSTTADLGPSYDEADDPR